MGLLKKSDYEMPKDTSALSSTLSDDGIISGVLKKPILNSELTITIPNYDSSSRLTEPTINTLASTESDQSSSDDVNLDRYDHNIYQAQDIVEPEGTPAEEVERLEKEAYDKGYQAAKNEMKDEFSQKIQAFDEAYQTIAAERDRVLEESQEGILNLSIRIAEKMLGAQLSANRSSLKTVLDEAFQKISASDKVVIRANPDDLTFVRESCADFEQKYSSVRSVTVEEDRSLDVGSCILETDYGFVDARLPMKVSIIEDAFNRVRLTDDND